MTPSQLWNRVKTFVETTIPNQGRVVKDEVCAKIYQEMKFLAIEPEASDAGEQK